MNFNRLIFILFLGFSSLTLNAARAQTCEDPETFHNVCYGPQNPYPNLVSSGGTLAFGDFPATFSQATFQTFLQADENEVQITRIEIDSPQHFFSFYPLPGQICESSVDGYCTSLGGSTLAPFSQSTIQLQFKSQGTIGLKTAVLRIYTPQQIHTVNISITIHPEGPLPRISNLTTSASIPNHSNVNFGNFSTLIPNTETYVVRFSNFALGQEGPYANVLELNNLRLSNNSQFSLTTMSGEPVANQYLISDLGHHDFKIEFSSLGLEFPGIQSVNLLADTNSSLGAIEVNLFAVIDDSPFILNCACPSTHGVQVGNGLSETAQARNQSESSTVMGCSVQPKNSVNFMGMIIFLCLQFVLYLSLRRMSGKS